MSATKTAKPLLTAAERGRLAELKPQERFGRNGYAMMPHGYFTVLPRKCSGWAQHFTVGYIIDRTFGAPGNPEWAKLTLSTLARFTGLTSQAFSLAIEDLVARGVVERKESGSGWVYRTWPEAWEAAPVCRDCGELSKCSCVKADAPEADAPEADAPEADAPSPVVVAVGKTSKPIVLSVTLKGVSSPVDMRFQTRNESGSPLQFLTSVDSSGTVRCTVRDGEAKANRPQVQLIGDPKSSRAGNADSYQVHLIDTPPANNKNQRLTDFKMYLSVACLKHFGKAADPLLVRQIVKNAGGASVDDFAAIVEARLSRRGRHSVGLLPELAKDAARAHVARTEMEAKNAPAVEDDAAHHAAFLARMRADIGDNAAAIADLRSIDPALAAELFGTTSGAQGD